MLRLPPFKFHMPTSLDEAAALIASEGPDVRVVAGGTDLWPNMKRRHQTAETVVSLMKIEELRAESWDSERGLVLGATRTLDEITRSAAVGEHYPALAAAVQSISSPPLRHMGTLGGNLCVDTRCTYYNQTEDWRRSISYCLKEAGDTCWVAPGSPKCLAHSASDSAPILCALGATVELLGPEGRREIPISSLFENDGIDYLTKQAGEILTRVSVPAASSAAHKRSAFWKLRRRSTIDFAVLSSSVVLETSESGEVLEAEIYLGAVSSSPLRADAACEHLVGKQLTEETIREAAEFARKPATPFDNTDFQAKWRGQMVSKYTEAALREAAGLDVERLAPAHG